jgi:nucleoid-associated protein YejK
MDKVTTHRNICADLNGIYEAKNKAYGDSFGKTFQELGIISAVTRMTDKMNRLTQMATQRSEGSADERLKDTLLDLANYSIMTIIELENLNK